MGITLGLNQTTAPIVVQGCLNLGGSLNLNASAPPSTSIGTTSSLTLMNVPSGCINGQFASVSVSTPSKCVKGTYQGRENLNSALAVFVRFDPDPDAADGCEPSSSPSLSIGREVYIYMLMGMLLLMVTIMW